MPVRARIALARRVAAGAIAAALPATAAALLLVATSCAPRRHVPAVADAPPPAPPPVAAAGLYVSLLWSAPGPPAVHVGDDPTTRRPRRRVDVELELPIVANRRVRAAHHPSRAVGRFVDLL
jgi:hypothetical protein